MVQLPPEEWRLLQSSHPNLLLAGQTSATSAALDALQTSFRGPVTVWRSGSPLVLPPPDAPGTLVLDNVGDLPPADQLRLIDWLLQDVGAVQVIASTAVPLLPLVERGAFLDALYYRLNVVCLNLVA
jgi:transcriptional regulator of acetoin/glycerol metabolism